MEACMKGKISVDKEKSTLFHIFVKWKTAVYEKKFKQCIYWKK